MAHIETILYTHLTSDASLATLVSNRIFPDLMPQNVALPAIRYTLIDRNELLAKPEVSTFRFVQARYQFDIFAKTYSSAKSIESALVNALYLLGSDVDSSVVSTRVFNVSGSSDSIEDEYRVTVEAYLTYNE